MISGHRCPVHNAAVGGASQSRHMEGDAADIKTRGYTGEQLRELAEKHIEAGIIPQGASAPTGASRPRCTTISPATPRGGGKLRGRRESLLWVAG